MVDPQQVDAIRLEPLQALLDGVDEVLRLLPVFASVGSFAAPPLYFVATTMSSRIGAMSSPSMDSDWPNW